MLRAGSIGVLLSVGCGQLAPSNSDAATDAPIDAANGDVTFDGAREADAAFVEEAAPPWERPMRTWTGLVRSDRAVL